MRISRRTLLTATAAVAAVVALGFSDPGGLLESIGLRHPPATIVVSGNIEAHESVVGFQSVQSRIVELPFDEGQAVKAGTLLAGVDDSDYRQQVAIARAALEVQKRQFDAAQENIEATRRTVASDRADIAQKTLDLARNKSLLRDGYVSTEAVDLAATALTQANAACERDLALQHVAEKSAALAQAGIASAAENLRLAELTLGYTKLVAPFDGVILVRQAELGEIVQPGTPVFTIADLDHVWLRAYLNETDLGRVRFGQTVSVTTDSSRGRKYQGRISFISPSAEFTPKSVETHAERVTLVYRVRIDIDNPTHELVPGMPADAEMDALPAGR